MIRLAFAVAFAVGVVAYAAPKLEQASAGHTSETVQTRPEPEAVAHTQGYRSLTLTADAGGHYRVETVINGRRLEMMADTGATAVVLTAEDARRIGIRLKDEDFTVKMRTANGIAYAAPVTLKDVRVSAIRVKNVRALVAQDGALSVNLLGMTFIGALSKFEMRGNKLTLVQ